MPLQGLYNKHSIHPLNNKLIRVFCDKFMDSLMTSARDSDAPLNDIKGRKLMINIRCIRYYRVINNDIKSTADYQLIIYNIIHKTY